MNLIIRILIEAVLAGAFVSVGVILIGVGGSITLPVGIVVLIIGILIFIHLVLATAFGRMGTPTDLGAGFRVPGAAERARRLAEDEEHKRYLAEQKERRSADQLDRRA